MLIKVKDDIKQLTKSLIIFRDQIPFATSKAINNTAFLAKINAAKRMESDLNNPKPFTVSGIKYKRSNKRNLTAIMFIDNTRYKYLKWMINGGRATPDGKAFAIGRNIKRNKYGNTARNAVKNMLARDDTFSGVINGTAGIWQRIGNKKRRLKLLFIYAPSRRFTKQYKWSESIQRTVKLEFGKQFTKAFPQAVTTARYT